MLAPQALNVVNTEVVIPKQVKLLGAKVKGVGIVTSVAVELPYCFALVTDSDGREHHVFVADLTKGNVIFPSELQPYWQVKRRVGYGLWNDMYELDIVPFSDLTHVDTLEAAA